MKKIKTSWGRAVPSSGQAGASYARTTYNSGHLLCVRKLSLLRWYSIYKEKGCLLFENN